MSAPDTHTRGCACVCVCGAVHSPRVEAPKPRLAPDLQARALDIAAGRLPRLLSLTRTGGRPACARPPVTVCVCGCVYVDV
jgi:hypothetical protein